ncbi:serine/threonine-protein kinase [Gemmata sp.]|uniref:serine/threonine-protein kinase n=1 Tax=Gemmata sp. TaxID=1914242 RepID=UPI003F707384
MDVITSLIAPIGTVAGAIGSTYTVATILIDQIGKRWRNKKAAEVLAFLKELGLKTDVDVRQAVENWTPPKGFTEQHKGELIGLLTNLVRSARFHSTNGTAVSSVLRSAQLIDQLLQNAQPRRKAGEKVQEWQLQSFLGMGAFGEVWRATKPLYPDPRVFKFFTMTGARDWLEREAGALMAVRRHLADCPNVIDYLDVEINAAPFPYLALEYAAGGSLEDWILRRPDDRPALNPYEVMRGIVRGMSAAHTHDIHHRDLKPANVLLTDGPEPVPKVCDFGLSTVDNQTESASSSMRSEMVLVGTRMYHPPEASDPFRKRLPAQDDVFALGVIWYQVLTSELVRPPYDFVDRLAAAGVDSRSIKLVSRCLAHPDRRYLSACELYDDLDVEKPPGPGEWAVPAGCFDVAGIVREYLEQRMR